MENNKCKYCQIELSNQNDDLGYRGNINHLVCKRCFDLINYNKLNHHQDESLLINEQLNDLFNNQEQTNYFLIIDSLSLIDENDTLIKQLKNLNKLIVVVNKADLIKHFNQQEYTNLILDKLEQLNLKIEYVLFTSINDLDSIKSLYEYLFKKPNNVFFGYSNVGKSSLIKALLDFEHLDNQYVLVNKQLNTTIIKKIYQFNKFNLIDTPGFIDKHNILNYVDNKYHKFIWLNQLNNIKGYQVKYPKTINIENLIYIDIYNHKNQLASVEFYMNNLLRINSYKQIKEHIFNQKHLISYKENDKSQIKTKLFELKKQKTFYVSIKGLGVIRLANVSKIKISYFNKLEVSLL